MTLLSVDDYRSFTTTSLDSDALQILLDANEQAIERELGGPVGSVTEVVDGGLSLLTLRRRVASITSVNEKLYGTTTTLAADDWRLRYDGRTLMRLNDGTHPGSWWGVTTVVYAAQDDLADRKRVQRLLTDLDLNYTPGTTLEQIGSWLQQQAQQPGRYLAERAAILASLWSVGELDFA